MSSAATTASVDNPPRPAYAVAKRVLDVVLTLLVLVLTCWLLLVVALLVRASGGPALFRQTRIGRDGRPFTMLKFRTMAVGADDALHRRFATAMILAPRPRAASDGVFKLRNDPRVTRVGMILRRTSLDELPQLFNVLRGEMSLVGPRPALPYEVELYDAHQRVRLEALPGLTGLWQVEGRGRVSLRAAIDLDVEYARRRSLALDLWILARTVPAVLSMRGAR